MEHEYDNWGEADRPARRSKKRREVIRDDEFDRPQKKAARRARHVDDEDDDDELDIEEEEDEEYYDDDDDDDDDDDLDVRRTRRQGPRDSEQSSHKLYGESLSGDELDDIINEEWVTYNDDSYDEEEDGWPYN